MVESVGDPLGAWKRLSWRRGPLISSVIMLIDGLDVRVLSDDGELLRHFTLDPTRSYQPKG